MTEIELERRERITSAMAHLKRKAAQLEGEAAVARAHAARLEDQAGRLWNEVWALEDLIAGLEAKR